MRQWPRVVGAAVLVAAFCVSCSPSPEEPAQGPAEGGATQSTSVATEVPDLSLAYPVEAVESDSPRTTVPTVAGRTSGGGSVLSDNGRVLAFVGATFSDTLVVEVLVGGLHDAAPDRASRSPEVPVPVENAHAVAVSSDGRYVLTATKSELSEGDTNDRSDLYRFDRLTGEQLRVSYDSFGAQIADGVQPQADMSGDASTVAFVTFGAKRDEPAIYAPDCRDNMIVAVSDVASGTTECVAVNLEGSPVGSGFSGITGEPALNYDGRFVAVSTTAPLGPDDGNGSASDIYVVDRTTGFVQRVSHGPDGADPDGASTRPRLSADGRYVAFASEASNLVDGDVNGLPDAFVYDRLTGVTERVSLASSGGEGDGAVGDQIDISWDGRFVAFDATATNLADVACRLYLRDRALGTTECIDVDNDGEAAEGFSRSPSISADGQLVAFSSSDTGLVGTETGAVGRVYVRDRGTVQDAAWPPDPGEIAAVEASVAPELISAAADGSGGGDGRSGGSSVSEDGRWVAFWSDATNLVPGATGGYQHIYFHDRETATTIRITEGANGDSNGYYSYAVAMSRDGQYLAFSSAASNLVDDDDNGSDDAFIYDHDAGKVTRISKAHDGSQLGGDARPVVLDSSGRIAVFDGRHADVVPGTAWCHMVSRDLGEGENECLALLPSGDPTRIERLAMSGDATTIAFNALSDDYVDADTNGETDLIALDRTTGAYEIVSVASDGTPSDSGKGLRTPAISDDGRLIAFTSNASTLVDGDTNGAIDVFLRDREAGTTIRLNVGLDGEEASSGSQGEVAISPNGRFVAFPNELLDDPLGGYGCSLTLLDTESNSRTCISVSASGQQWRGREPFLQDSFATFSSADPVVSGLEPGEGPNIYFRPLGDATTSVTPEISVVPDRLPGVEPLMNGPADGEPTPQQLEAATAEAGVPVDPDAALVESVGDIVGVAVLRAAENDRAEIEQTLGAPDAFTISYEYGMDGTTLVRYESWTYFDMLTAFEFADAKLTAYAPVSDPGGGAIAVPYHPLDFDRLTTWEDVTRLLASPETAVPFEVPIETGFAGAAWSTSQLLAMFDETGMVHVEAFPVTGGEDA